MLIYNSVYFTFLFAWLALGNCSIGVDLSVEMSENDWNGLLVANPEVSFASVQVYYFNGTLNPYAHTTIRTALASGIEDISAYMYPCIDNSTYSKTFNIYCGSAEEQLLRIVDYLGEYQIYFESYSVANITVYEPTATPTTQPTESPTDSPSQAPTNAPTYMRTSSPTATPTVNPSASPSEVPTTVPTLAPTYAVTNAPTAEPTFPDPTAIPTTAPTFNNTLAPTELPTASPTTSPSGAPTCSPTLSPTAQPTIVPTGAPSAWPTEMPTALPTQQPTIENKIMLRRLFVNIEDESPNRYFAEQHYLNVRFLADLVNAANQLGVQIGIYTTRKDWFNIMADKPSRTEPYVFPTSNNTVEAVNPFRRLPLWLPRYDSINNMEFFGRFADWNRVFMKQTSGGSSSQRRIGSDRIGTDFIDDETNNSTTIFATQTLEFIVLP